MLARRESPSPFEFGDIQQRDRMAATAFLMKKEQKILPASIEMLHVFDLDGRQINGIPLAKAAFSQIRSAFNSAGWMFSPGRICGFLTDRPLANGVAWEIHTGEDVYGIAVASGAVFETIVSAYRLLCNPQIEPTLSVGGILEGAAEGLNIPEFKAPASRARRDLALRYAAFGLHAVFFHELAHVLRGHLGYLYSARGMSSIEEAAPLQVGHDDMSGLFIETDADDVAGRLLAKIALKPFLSSDILASEEGRRLAFDILVGVSLVFSAFPRKDSLYHSGGLRVYVFMSGLLSTCGVDRKRAARWVWDRVSSVQDLMHACGVLKEDQGRFSIQELHDLITVTLPGIQSIQKDFLAFRPFDTDDSPAPR